MLRIKLVPIVFCACLSFVPPVLAQGISEVTIKAAITNALRTKPPWEIIRGNFYGPRNVNVTSITITRRGPHNHGGYWPVQARVAGRFEARGYDLKYYTFTFDGTSDFRIHKNDYGDWTADYATPWSVDQQLYPTLSTGERGTEALIGGRSGHVSYTEELQLQRKKFDLFWPRFRSAVRHRSLLSLQAMMVPKFEHNGESLAAREVVMRLRAQKDIWQILDRIVSEEPKPEMYNAWPGNYIVPGDSLPGFRYSGWHVIFRIGQVTKGDDWKWSALRFFVDSAATQPAPGPEPKAALAVSSVSKTGANSWKVTLLATENWYDTRIHVRQEEEFDVNGTGEIIWDPNRPAVGPSGAPFQALALGQEQSDKFPMPAARCGHLVMRIGTSLYALDSTNQMKAPYDGTIELMVNDAVDGLADNVGHYDITIIGNRTRRPVLTRTEPPDSTSSGSIHLDVAFMAQVPPGKWGRFTRNCGQTSLAMALAFYGHRAPDQQDIKDIDDWLFKSKWHDPVNNYNGSETTVAKLFAYAVAWRLSGRM